jgi:hypothetical protein
MVARPDEIRHGPVAECSQCRLATVSRRPRGDLERWTHLARQPPAHPPARAGERVVGHGGEPGLVLAQGEQQVGDAVGGREVRVARRSR